MRRLLLAFALLYPATATAQAVPPLPEWDRRAHCERQNRILGTESAYMLRSCLQVEDRAAERMTREWDALSGPIRRTCLQQQDLLGMASYYMLDACVRVEQQATRDLERRR